MKRPNSTGSIVKLKGNRRNPYCIKIFVGYGKSKSGKIYPKQRCISYHPDFKSAEKALCLYLHEGIRIDKSLTFLDLYEEWKVAYFKNLQPKTIVHYKRSFSDLKYFHSMPITKITSESIFKYCIQKQFTPSMCSMMLSLLCVMFEYAKQMGYITEQQYFSIKGINRKNLFKMLPQGYKVERKIFTNKEIKSYIDNPTIFHREILSMIFTGLRISEYCNLKEEDIKDNFISVKQSKTKSGIRIVPMNKLLQKYFIMPQHAYRTLQNYAQAHNFTVHNCRHTCVTLLAEKGVPEIHINMIIGHSNNSITDIYLHQINKEVLMDDMNKICEDFI